MWNNVQVQNYDLLIVKDPCLNTLLVEQGYNNYFAV